MKHCAKELEALAGIVGEYTETVSANKRNLRHKAIQQLLKILIHDVGDSLWTSKMVYGDLIKQTVQGNKRKLQFAGTKFKTVHVNEAAVEYVTDKEVQEAKQAQAEERSGLEAKSQTMGKTTESSKAINLYYSMLYCKPSVYNLSQSKELIYLLSENVMNDEALFGKFMHKFTALVRVVKRMLHTLKPCLTIHSTRKINSRMAVNTYVANLIQGFASDYKMYTGKHLNLMLLGNAGTGKSRYAKIIANVMGQLGILLRASDKNIDIVSSHSLRGQYLGSLRRKLDLVCQKFRKCRAN